MVSQESWSGVIDLFVDLLPLKDWNLSTRSFKKRKGHRMTLFAS